MAVHPLRPATDRRLGGPLPRQQANQTRTHPAPHALSARPHAGPCAYAVLAAVSSCCPPVRGRLSTRYSPVRHSVRGASSPKKFRPSASFDLHVLGTPPAFILSQDQTLIKSVVLPVFPPSTLACVPNQGKVSRYPSGLLFLRCIFRCRS